MQKRFKYLVLVKNDEKVCFVEFVEISSISLHINSTSSIKTENCITSIRIIVAFLN